MKVKKSVRGSKLSERENQVLAYLSRFTRVVPKREYCDGRKIPFSDEEHPWTDISYIEAQVFSDESDSDMFGWQGKSSGSRRRCWADVVAESLISRGLAEDELYSDCIRLTVRGLKIGHRLAVNEDFFE